MLNLKKIEEVFTMGNVKVRREINYKGEETPHIIADVSFCDKKEGSLLLNINSYQTNKAIIREIWKFIKTGK